MSSLDHHELAAFLHLSDSLHFGRSARALNMSASALTRSVQRIEAALGQRVLERSRRTVALTRAGEILRDHARAHMASHARLVEALAAEAVVPTGELRIACTVTACHSVLPRLLARFRDRYRGIHLQLSTSDAARCLHRLENDEADVAVVPEPDPPSGELRFVRLAYTELSLVAPSTDKELGRRAALGGSHWRGLPVILPRRGLDRERVDAWFASRSIEPEIYAEVEGNEGILAMVALGCGVGIVPELVRKASTLRGRIETVELARPPRGYHVSLCAKQRTLARRTIAALWELAPASAPMGD
jgi:LysR family transcriptional regulator, positive regulator for ilvC